MGGVGLAMGKRSPGATNRWGAGAKDEGTSLLLSPKLGPRQLELPGEPDHRWRKRFIKHESALQPGGPGSLEKSELL